MPSLSSRRRLSRRAPSAPLLAPQPIATPAAANSAQPQLSVSKRGVLLSWIERSRRSRHAEVLRAHRERMDAPRRRSRPAATGSSTGPMCRRCCDCRRARSSRTGCRRARASTYAYDVRLSYSTDDGKTWSPSFLPHHDGTPTEHGFASLFPIGDGFGLVWLDGRFDSPGANAGARSGQAAAHDEHVRRDERPLRALRSGASSRSKNPSSMRRCASAARRRRR